MKEERQKLLCFVTTAIVSLHLAFGQNVIETIGFGQEADDSREGETGSIRIRLRPQPIAVDVSGQVVPLSISQYENYTFATQRTVPQSVQDAINAISDPAEYEEGTGGRRDFNNTVLNFTITAGNDAFDVDISTLISEDEVNEAAEQFILVLEADSNEVEFDAQEGILVVTILDNNAIFLNFNISTYTFSESDGTVANVIKVQKNASSPDTEVDIPVQVVTLSGTAVADTDGDVEVASYNRTYTIRVNETEVEVDAITIVDDAFPERDEGFTLSLMKGDGTDTLNFFPSISVVKMAIIDNDVAQVGFTQSIYLVTEGESSFVEVCITVTDGQSLSSSLGYGNFEVLINNTYSSATVNSRDKELCVKSDYDAIPSPNTLTIERGQEIACTNITINDDIIVETLEEFSVSVVAINNTFSAGVTLTQDLASVEIDDNDGAIVGFALSNYTGAEGEAIEVCVTIHSPNQTVLDMSDVEGEFSITGSSGSDTFASVTILVLNSSIAEQCFNLLLLSDGLVEGTEIVMLTLQLNSNIFGIRDIAPNTTVVTIIDEDFAVIDFMQSAYEVNELEQSGQDSVIDVCVQLLNGTIAPGVSVNYTLDYDSGDTTQSFLINSTMGVFTAGTASVCHSVRVLENDVVERDGTITVSIENSSLEPPNTELNISEADVTIIDSDILMVSVEISTSTIMEGASTTLSVTYDGNLHQESTVTVDIITTDGTANGSDYHLGIGSPHSVTLSTPNPRSEFTVLAVDDQELEDSWETFSVSIALRNLEVMAATETDKSKVVVTIEDNEEVVFSFRNSSYKISEALVGSHPIFVDIENFDSVIIPPLTVGISLSAVVNFMTSNATQGIDYLITNNDREFRHNTQSLDVVIEIKHDLLVEGNEVIYLSLTQPIIDGLNSSAAVVRGHRDTVFTILDDDEINVGFNASSHTGEEGDTIIVCVESSDGILGQGITLDYLITAPREDFALPIGSQADTADATSTEMSLDGDYSLTSERVSITASITSRCIEMELINDTIVETDEVFLVQVEQIISSDDLVFTLSTEFTEVTIIDNDEIMMGFETREYQFSENAGSLPNSVYIVRENLVTVSSSFIVTVVLQDHSTATDGTDFMVPGGFNVTIMFGGEDDRQPFPLDILEDMVGEGDETIELLLTTPGRLDGVIPGMNSSTKVVILKNDFIQYHYTQTEYSFTETAPSSEVCLRIISGVFAPGGYLTLSLFTSTLTAIAGVDFNPILAPTMVTLSNNTRLVCTNVSITKDELVEGQEMFNVYFDISALKGSYSVNGSSTTLINILDSNVAKVGFKSALYTVVEGEDVMVTVCVSVLSGQLTSVVSLNYSLSVQPLTASENVDYGPNILPANATLSLFDNSSCHSLPVYDDEGVEPPETFTVTIIPTGPSSEFVALFDVTMLKTTVVEIIDNDRRCPVEVSGGIQWQWTLEGTTVSRPCSDAGSMFRVGPRALRKCNEEGEWDEADLTSCTLAEVEEPFLLFWFVIEADAYTDDMEQGFVDSMKMLLDLNGVVYSRVFLQSAYVASVSLTFQVDLWEGDQSENITQFSTFLRNSEAFLSFSDYTVMESGRGLVDISVSETCMCSSANLGSSLQLCAGAAISPCNCMDAVCSCQTPFVGDGISCTLDSDLDGYPDQALDSSLCTANSSLTYCIADVCPEVTNPEQDPVTCQPDATAMEVLTGCPYGPDDSGGSHGPTLLEDSSAPNPALVEWMLLAEAALPPADAVILEVTPVLLESAAVISEQLVMATDSEEAVGLLPLDLNTTNNVVAQVLNILESSVEDRIDDAANEELVEVFNNILNETNQVGWTELQTVASGSQTLLQNAERYGAYLAKTVNSTDESVVLVRENIVVKAEVVDTSSVSDVVFPTSADELDNFTVIEMDDSAQITIPAAAITRLSTGNSSADLAIVHIIFRNIEDFLPAITSVLSDSRSASLVISSQFGGPYQTNIPDDVFLENPITLNFSFTKNTDVVTNYAGVFWNFSDPVGSGGWSSEGVQVLSSVTRGSVTTVLCNSTHLTSFAVLVDVAGGLEDVSKEEQLALQVISYIGCIISTICLSITVVFYLAMGKKLFSSVHYFVHLNLALSLLLGYVVFMFGIELGTSSKGGCAFVAALLQYLFLSAFCWMMCEGVMLYLMLIVVFSKLSNKWWFFMLLGYCTPLIFVVVGLAARADYYGVRGDDGELSFCWLSTEKGTNFAFVAPMIAIIIINTVFLVLALVALVHSKNQKAKTVKKDKAVNQAMAILRATLILLPLLGLTWLFGLLTLNHNATAFAWLFTIFNSLQGAAIFFFHVVRSDKVWSKISPKLSFLKQSIYKSSHKFSLSIYTASRGQSSTGNMLTLLHKKPLDSKHFYEPSERVMSSTTNESQVSSCISESGLERETDTDKKPLEPIAEGGNMEGSNECSNPLSGSGAGCVERESHTEAAGDGDVIHNPNTSDENGSSNEGQNREEVSTL